MGKKMKQLNDSADYEEVESLPQKWSLIKQFWHLKFVTDGGQTVKRYLTGEQSRHEKIHVPCPHYKP